MHSQKLEHGDTTSRRPTVRAGQRRLTFKVKRAYDEPAPSDGCRILVDRLWPRGVSKEAAAIDAWVKSVAPSDELRHWFGHDPSKWAAFEKKYFRELDARKEALAELLEACSQRTVTLVFGAKDVAHNNAVALKKYLEQHAASGH